MKKHRLLARCLEPVAITQDSLKVCIAIASDDQWFGGDRARALEAAGGMLSLGEPRAPMAVDNGVATIAVEGPLMRKAGGIEKASGLSSYDAIRKDLRVALASKEVRSIDWAFDSPGGEVSGLFELADEIHAARSRKPMRALVAQANSAAYVLASAVGNIAIEQAGQAGSIGVIAAVQKPGDDGTIEFVSSVSPLKRPDINTDEGRAQYQDRVDYLGERLVEKVAAYRGTTPERVKEGFGRGSVLIGAQAITAGLADRIGAVVALSSPSSFTAASAGIRAVTAQEMNPMNCTGCEQPINPGDPAYCAACAGKEEAAKTAVAQVQRVVTLAGASAFDEAFGKLTAGIEALGERDSLRAELASERQANRSRTLRDALSAAIDDKRINLGELARVVPTLLGAARSDAAKAIESAAQEGPALVAAICGVTLPAEAVDSVAAYLGAKSPSVKPAPKMQPEIPAAAAEKVLEALTAEQQRVTDTAEATRAHFRKQSPTRGTAAK